MDLAAMLGEDPNYVPSPQPQQQPPTRTGSKNAGERRVIDIPRHHFMTFVHTCPETSLHYNSDPNPFNMNPRSRSVMLKPQAGRGAAASRDQRRAVENNARKLQRERAINRQVV